MSGLAEQILEAKAGVDKIATDEKHATRHLKAASESLRQALIALRLAALNKQLEEDGLGADFQIVAKPTTTYRDGGQIPEHLRARAQAARDVGGKGPFGPTE